MTPAPVVEHLDVIADIGPGFFSGSVGAATNALAIVPESVVRKAGARPVSLEFSKIVVLRWEGGCQALDIVDA